MDSLNFYPPHFMLPARPLSPESKRLAKLSSDKGRNLSQITSDVNRARRQASQDVFKRTPGLGHLQRTHLPDDPSDYSQRDVSEYLDELAWRDFDGYFDSATLTDRVQPAPGGSGTDTTSTGYGREPSPLPGDMDSFSACNTQRRTGSTQDPGEQMGRAGLGTSEASSSHQDPPPSDARGRTAVGAVRTPRAKSRTAPSSGRASGSRQARDDRGEKRPTKHQDKYPGVMSTELTDNEVDEGNSNAISRMGMRRARLNPEKLQKDRERQAEYRTRPEVIERDAAYHAKYDAEYGIRPDVVERRATLRARPEAKQGKAKYDAERARKKTKHLAGK